MDTDLTRREFVAAGGAGLMGTLAFAAGPVALLAPSRTWALALERLDPHTGETLIHVTRHIYPHESLENAVYALVVKALDAEAARNHQEVARQEAQPGQEFGQHRQARLELLMSLVLIRCETRPKLGHDLLNLFFGGFCDQ